jgi:subtilisin family serine protease
MSSAVPAPGRALPQRDPFAAAVDVVIGVLDSGLADGPLRPAFLPVGVSGQPDFPSVSIDNEPVDGYLDPVAGHGTFIAGIVEQLTPGCTIRVSKVFEPQGDVSIAQLTPALVAMMNHQLRPTIVNLSFGGTHPAGQPGKDLDVFGAHVADYCAQGVVFVAAAGNEGTCVEQYPAAWPFVLGVAALGPTGPAPWSNYGDWVDACAPGTDLVSSFFADFDGALPTVNGMDADEFASWATWSGTSFAAPVVVAALAREMATTGCPAGTAVDRVVRANHLARLPSMGTIVNL